MNKNNRQKKNNIFTTKYFDSLGQLFGKKTEEKEEKNEKKVDEKELKNS